MTLTDGHDPLSGFSVGMIGVGHGRFVLAAADMSDAVFDMCQDNTHDRGKGDQWQQRELEAEVVGQCAIAGEASPPTETARPSVTPLAVALGPNTVTA